MFMEIGAHFKSSSVRILQPTYAMSDIFLKDEFNRLRPKFKEGQKIAYDYDANNEWIGLKWEWIAVIREGYPTIYFHSFYGGTFND